MKEKHKVQYVIIVSEVKYQTADNNQKFLQHLFCKAVNKVYRFFTGSNKGELIITKDFCPPFEGVRIVNRGYLKKDNKDNSSLMRKLGDYDLSEAVVIADNDTASVLGISDVFFRAVKYELTRNISFIMDKIKQRFKGDESAALVISGSGWEIKELYLILTTVKNYYKKIDIITDNETMNFNRLIEAVYDEWGLMLHRYSIKDYHGEKKDFVLYLVRSWNDRLKRIVPFSIAYVVEEKCSINKCLMREKRDMGMEEIYSGLSYRTESGENVPFGVHLAWQKPVIYEKFHVSVIDICEF